MDEKERFYELVNQFDYLIPLWDQNRHKIDRNAFEQRLKTMSSGEKHVAQFLACVWLNQNDYGFDLVDAIGSCDGKFRQVIQTWVADPFWP